MVFLGDACFSFDQICGDQILSWPSSQIKYNEGNIVQYDTIKYGTFKKS